MLIREKMETIKFSPAEKEVVDYLLLYPEVLDEKTMQEIAAETYTQPSTLIRIAKKLGFGMGGMQKGLPGGARLSDPQFRRHRCQPAVQSQRLDHDDQ